MKWFLVVLLSLFGFLLLIKGIELWAIIDQVDNDGIGLHFLGVEINEVVLKEQLPSYAFGFIAAAMIPTLVAINIAIKIKISKKSNLPIV